MSQVDLPPAVSRRPRSFFSRGGTGRHIVGLLGDSLMQMGGLHPHTMPMMEKRALWERRDHWPRWDEIDDHEAPTRGAPWAKDYRPRGFFQIGEDPDTPWSWARMPGGLRLDQA